MKILAFAASNSSKSLNKQLIAYAARLLGEGLAGDDVAVETLDIHDFEMPIYSTDRQEEGGIPDKAQAFFDKVGRSDAVLISFAEHNGSYTAAYKNLFDWASRIDMAVYQGRPAVLLATSPGPRGGAHVLGTAVESGVFFGYDVKASLAIPSFYDNFDPETGSLTNADLDEQLRAALALFGSTTQETS